jgi:hypothetical protein
VERESKDKRKSFVYLFYYDEKILVFCAVYLTKDIEKVKILKSLYKITKKQGLQYDFE